MKFIALLIVAASLAIPNAAGATGYQMNQNHAACRTRNYKDTSAPWPVGDLGEYATNERMTGVTTVGSGSFSPIYCPLTVFDSVSWVIAYVWDKSSTANVSCTVYAYDETGSVQYSATRASSGVDTSAPQQLSWDMSSVTVKYATMECSVPQTASLGNTSGIAQMIVYY